MEIQRTHLSLDEVTKQAHYLKQRGFKHLLVVGGDFPRLTTAAYYRTLVRSLVELGVTPAVEIAAQSVDSYAELTRAGNCGVTLYQETYDQGLYPEYHVRGPKSSFHWRLEALDRAAEGGVRRLGLGILLGLSDAREDLRQMLRHAAYLTRRFPKCSIAFSLPRIHRAPDGFQVPHPVSDDELVRLYCILRIAFPDANLVLSTRENAALRNRLAKICITQMPNDLTDNHRVRIHASGDHLGRHRSLYTCQQRQHVDHRRKLTVCTHICKYFNYILVFCQGVRWRLDKALMCRRSITHRNSLPPDANAPSAVLASTARVIGGTVWPKLRYL